MISNETLVDAQAFARGIFAGDASGHDVEHTMRAVRTARRIAREEGADEGIVCLAALLHDVDDAKLSPETAESLGNARAFLAEHNVDADETQAVLTAIREVSFSKNRDTAPSTLESACVRDADRLDAIGAIGVARTFAFGGSRGRALYDPTRTDRGTTIAHFYDKLLLLKDMMVTREGKRMAKERDRFLRTFLDEFLAEWEGER